MYYVKQFFQRINRFFLRIPRFFIQFIPVGGFADFLLKRRLYRALLFPLTLIYYEILLRAFTGTGVFATLFYPVVFAISFGFLLDGVMSLFRPRLRWHLTNILMAVIAFYFGLEAVLRNTYQIYMSLSTIFSELGNVAGNYGGDLAAGIRGAVPVIIMYYIPFVLHLLIRVKQKKQRRYRLRVTITLFVLWFLVGCFGVLFASHMPGVRGKYASQYEYDTGIRTFGLTEGTYLNMKYSVFGNRKAETFAVMATEEETTEPVLTGQIEEVEETEEITVEEPVVTGYNVMDIDFDELIAETDDEAIRDIHEYVNSLTPSAKNEYTGLFEGKNLITIAAEAFSLQVINEELTPTLYRMANDGIKFTNAYQPAWGGSTSTGEYSILLGLVPTNSTDSILDTIGDNMYFTTGNQFQRLGYTSLAFHNGDYTYYDRDKTHVNLGYDQFLAWGNGLEDLAPLWCSDSTLVEDIMGSFIDKQPFNVYWMTLSGHCTYTEDNEKTKEYYDQVKAYYGDTYKDTTLYYLCYQMELEKALTIMVEELEEAGIADDTVIVICPDHYPYGLAKSSTFGNDEDYLLDLYKVDSYDGFVRDKTSIIIWSECIEGMNLEVDEPVSSLDILPTISNLFGLEYDSRLLVGRDVFSDEEPIIMWTDHSFLTEKGWYNADTGVFLSTTDEEVTDEYLDRIKTIVSNKITFSAAVPKYDYYGILFGEDDVK